MEVTIKLPTPLRRHANQNKTAVVAANTVGEALTQLVAAHPAMNDALFTPAGELKSFVRVFVGSRDIADLQGLDTSLTAEDIVSILPPVAGA